MKKKKFGFTMAEVLIAIAIIGVIAALVLPVMMKNYNNRIFATKARRAYTAVVDACSHGLSDDQVLYPGDIIYNYCDYIPAKECNAEKILLRDGTVLTLAGWGNNPGGDLDVRIDTNDTKGPNTEGRDIWITKLTRDCKLNDDGSSKTISSLKAHDWKISDELTEEEKLAKRRDFSKWKAEVISQPLTKAKCDDLVKNKPELGIKECSYNNDYWAAAVEKCGGIQNLPTEEDLIELARLLYPTCNNPDLYVNTVCNGGLDSSKIPEGLEGIGSSWSTIWSNVEVSSVKAYNRHYYSAKSDRYYYNARNGSGSRVVCLGDLK